MLLPLFGGALAVIGGVLLERRRSSQTARRYHLREIQDHVLRPLEQKIRSYFMPILQPTISNIELSKRSRLHEPPRATENLLEYNEELQCIMSGWSVLGAPSEVLYECSKRVHYSEAIQHYETLQRDIDYYNAQCLEYVQSVAERIIDATGLPIHAHALKQDTSPWIRAEALAFHIYQRQQGLQDRGIRLRSPTRDVPQSSGIELPDGSAAIYGIAQTEAERILDLLTNLEHSRDHIDDLRDKASGLQQDAISLCGELERLRHASTIKGTCDLIAR